MKWMTAIGSLTIFGLWVYSHVAPAGFGVCHEVAVSIGSDPTVRECEAYGAADFAVPLAALAIGILLGSDADVELPIPGWETLKRTRQAREAVQTLHRTEAALDEREEEFLKLLPPPAGGEAVSGDVGHGGN